MSAEASGHGVNEKPWWDLLCVKCLHIRLFIEDKSFSVLYGNYTVSLKGSPMFRLPTFFINGTPFRQYIFTLYAIFRGVRILQIVSPPGPLAAVYSFPRAIIFSLSEKNNGAILDIYWPGLAVSLLFPLSSILDGLSGARVTSVLVSLSRFF